MQQVLDSVTESYIYLLSGDGTKSPVTKEKCSASNILQSGIILREEFGRGPCHLEKVRHGNLHRGANDIAVSQRKKSSIVMSSDKNEEWDGYLRLIVIEAEVIKLNG